ncbi:putative COPII coat assembly protein SEC16 [Hibiscus syriacus]|uniref:HVA22-like protein n=1 Tax=Hibiscus syriacus TaxID=106335 RepID=A0A6A2YAW2_HIBSY|nr:putative COPII coat assembly protein SEC16 [Hibiscus syriacus]
MLGELITRVLVLVLGYGFPAIECFKTVEKNKVSIEELRFWCQYWIVVAFLTLFESIGDTLFLWYVSFGHEKIVKPQHEYVKHNTIIIRIHVFLDRILLLLFFFSQLFLRLPIYGELKLTLLIYLWYPKTKGTGYVYDTLLRPYMVRHETEFGRTIQEWRARAWDFALCYWENCTELGQTKWVEISQFLSGQPSRMKQGKLINPVLDHQMEFDEKRPARRRLFGGKAH